ncbi:MAG: glutamine amidotransferase [Anaerolineales bacterium]
MKKPLCILKTGSAYREYRKTSGDFEDWIIQLIRSSDLEWRVVDVTKGESLPNWHGLSGVIITGSHAMITEHRAWSERCAEWLAEASSDGLAALGICYGHQLLAYAFGGKVAKNPFGIELGTTEIELNENAENDLLFSSLPKRFQAHVSHKQSVVTLPPGAVKLAQSAHEAYQVVRYAARIWGVQFHPEFSSDYVRYEIERYRNRLSKTGQDVQQLLKMVQETPVSASLLQKFCKLLES